MNDSKSYVYEVTPAEGQSADDVYKKVCAVLGSGVPRPDENGTITVLCSAKNAAKIRRRVRPAIVRRIGAQG
jgi:hypothetical protein